MPLVIPVYSFADVYGVIAGPAGSIPFGNGFGHAEEGISFDQAEDANRKTVGADGVAMNTLILDISGTATIHTLKTSPLNAALTQMFNSDKLSSLTWAKNIISVTNPVSGDQYTCNGVAFKRRARNSFGKEANNLDWEFDCSQIFVTLGGLQL